MTRALPELLNAFDAIRHEDQIDDLLGRFELTPGKLEDYPDVRNLLAVYEGCVAETKVTLLHRWHDPSQAFCTRPDVVKLELRVDGLPTHFREFPESP